MVLPALLDEYLEQFHEFVARHVHILNTARQRLAGGQEDQIPHQARVCDGGLRVLHLERELQFIDEGALAPALLQEHVHSLFDQRSVLLDDGSLDLAELQED